MAEYRIRVEYDYDYVWDGDCEPPQRDPMVVFVEHGEECSLGVMHWEVIDSMGGCYLDDEYTAEMVVAEYGMMPNG